MPLYTQLVYLYSLIVVLEPDPRTIKKEGLVNGGGVEMYTAECY